MTRTIALLVSCAALLAAQAPQGVPENATQKLTAHVYVIAGFPNVEFVVGSRATLVVDTGMGRKNGAVVAKEAAKLASNPVLYLTTTHFHPEHSMGEEAFPPNTVIVRPAVQQKELEERGAEFVEMFSRNPANKELLKDVKQRKPDITFDRELNLDLGGVTARLFWFGPGHTRGDELIYVPEDGTLISGDIVQSKLAPNLPNADATVKGWLALLDQVERLHPTHIVPDHGEWGGAELIAQQRAFMIDARTRALELRKQGVSADDAGKQLQAEFKTKYPGWTNLNPLANYVRRVYAEGE